MSENKLVLLAKKELVISEIISSASKLVKDSEDDVRGMTEVSTRLLNELDNHLHAYDTICKDIAQHEIDNM